jgi:dipeptidase
MKISKHHNSIIKYCILVVFLSISELGFAQGFSKEENCFSMIVGREASSEGNVFLAHNEDDWGELYVDWHKVPRMNHEENEKIQLVKGGMVDQVPETPAFLWLEMPGMEFSDSYLNEYGVAIASNQCRSKEDQGELTEGGISFYLRRLMIERAKTSREAVKIGGALIEKWGYSYSGRTYLIADKNEGWMMSVVKGKHWVAQRIPDDHVAIIPNYYTIQEIDLRDTANFMGSDDIITYAIERGWFDPDKGKRFNFREAYADTETRYGIWNIPRHVDAINHFAAKKFSYSYDLPFSFKPQKALTLSAIMDVMDSHGEGTQFEVPPNYEKGNPHKTVIKRVCSEGNQYGMIAQLRDDLPDPVAHVLWLAPKRPCLQPFIPWYIGIDSIPELYSRGEPLKCLENHFSEDQIKAQTSGKAYWVYKELADKVDENYAANISLFTDSKNQFQQELVNKQPLFEQLFLEIYKKDPEKAIDLLNEYVAVLAEKMVANTASKLTEIAQ